MSAVVQIFQLTVMKMSKKKYKNIFNESVAAELKNIKYGLDGSKFSIRHIKDNSFNVSFDIKLSSKLYSNDDVVYLGIDVINTFDCVITNIEYDYEVIETKFYTISFDLDVSSIDSSFCFNIFIDNKKIGNKTIEIKHKKFKNEKESKISDNEPVGEVENLVIRDTDNQV